MRTVCSIVKNNLFVAENQGLGNNSFMGASTQTRLPRAFVAHEQIVLDLANNLFQSLPITTGEPGTVNTLDWHPLANAFPLIEGPQFDDLVASIKANGLRHPIIVLDGLILDGRNRYRACEVAGVTPRFEEFTGSDPLTFVIDENLNRRHMNESQRAMAAAKLVTLRRGQRADFAARSEEAQICASSPISLEDAAQKMNVSKRAVTYARTILNRGTPDEVRAVELGSARVGQLGTMIERGIPAGERGNRPLRDKKANSARAETLRSKAALWSELREALTRLNNLPSPHDVAATIRNLSGDKKSRADFLALHLETSIHWLKEFFDEWERNASADRASPARGKDGSFDAGNGTRAA